MDSDTDVDRVTSDGDPAKWATLGGVHPDLPALAAHLMAGHTTDEYRAIADRLTQIANIYLAREAHRLIEGVEAILRKALRGPT